MRNYYFLTSQEFGEILILVRAVLFVFFVTIVFVI